MSTLICVVLIMVVANVVATTAQTIELEGGDGNVVFQSGEGKELVEMRLTSDYTISVTGDMMVMGNLTVLGRTTHATVDDDLLSLTISNLTTELDNLQAHLDKNSDSVTKKFAASNYNELMMMLEPTVYYKMDTSDYAHDSSGNEHHATYSEPQFLEFSNITKFDPLCNDGGNAIRTKPVTEQKAGIVRDPQGVEADHAFSMAVWTSLHAYGTYDSQSWLFTYGGRDDCCCAGDQKEDHSTMYIYTREVDPRLHVVFDNDWIFDDGYGVASSNTTIEIDRVYFIAVTWDKYGDGRIRIYIDGVLDGIGEPWFKYIGPSGIDDFNGSGFNIMHREAGNGCGPSTGGGLRQWVGRMDNFAYWTEEAITPEAIAELYEHGKMPGHETQ